MDVQALIKQEVRDYWDKHGSDHDRAKADAIDREKDEQFTILQYVLMRSEVGDIYTQLVMLTEFTSEYIQEGSDGNELSMTYLDFMNTVEWLSSIERGPLGDLQEGRNYL